MIRDERFRRRADHAPERPAIALDQGRVPRAGRGAQRGVGVVASRIRELVDARIRQTEAPRRHTAPAVTSPTVTLFARQSGVFQGPRRGAASGKKATTPEGPGAVDNRRNSALAVGQTTPLEWFPVSRRCSQPRTSFHAHDSASQSERHVRVPRVTRGGRFK